MFIFNLSSTVYASHKSKDERFIATGTLVSTGLAFLAKAEVIAVLSAVALRLGMDMNNTTQSAVQEFYENYPDVVQSAKNFGKSENGLIAVSKNAIDKFTSFLKDTFEKNPEGSVSDGMIRFVLTKDNISSFSGLQVGPYPTDVTAGRWGGATYDQVLVKGHYFKLYVSNTTLGPVLKAKYFQPSGGILDIQFKSVLTFPLDYKWGDYLPGNSLKDDEDNIYTGKGDFILNPSWDINTNVGTLEGFPPWSIDKENSSAGSIGVLNPDGTITVPDNPSIPDTDVGEQTGILGWLSKFWENLWNFFMELVKALFYPTAAIAAWENLKNTINDNFKFIGQLNNIKWSTSNNKRLKIPFSYAKTTTYITIPDYIEDNYVITFRSLFKYFIYALTLFVCVQILRPKLTVGTR